MVVADDRARRESQGLQQKVLGCSGKLPNVEKDEGGDAVCVSLLQRFRMWGGWCCGGACPPDLAGRDLKECVRKCEVDGWV